MLQLSQMKMLQILPNLTTGSTFCPFVRFVFRETCYVDQVILHTIYSLHFLRAYAYLMYIVHDKAIPQPLSSFNCGIKTEILSNFRPIPTARFKFTLVLFETDDVIISCTIMCCLRNILWWVKWCQKYHLKYKSRDILIKTKSNQFVEDNYRLPQRMAFTLTSSNCKVKIARFCEFLFTLGWG